MIVKEHWIREKDYGFDSMMKEVFSNYQFFGHTHFYWIMALPGGMADRYKENAGANLAKWEFDATDRGL